MGSCFSKCRPKKQDLVDEEEFNYVQDKLVISQAPRSPVPQYPDKISPSPPWSTWSISSFTCSSTGASNNTISSSGTSSSTFCYKDTPFSNEFLWSCYKENPHIIRINSLKESCVSLVMTKAPSHKIKQWPKQKLSNSTSMPKKRGRSLSPSNLTRQKSFRKEPEKPNPSYSIPNKTLLLRSPSPSRRFNASTVASNKFIMGPKPSNTSNTISCSMRNIEKEEASPACPNNHKNRVMSNSESDHDIDSALIEDIDNPLISLDCFIFL